MSILSQVESEGQRINSLKNCQDAVTRRRRNVGVVEQEHLPYRAGGLGSSTWPYFSEREFCLEVTLNIY